MSHHITKYPGDTIEVTSREKKEEITSHHITSHPSLVSLAHKSSSRSGIKDGEFGEEEFTVAKEVSGASCSSFLFRFVVWFAHHENFLLTIFFSLSLCAHTPPPVVQIDSSAKGESEQNKEIVEGAMEENKGEEAHEAAEKEKLTQRLSRNQLVREAKRKKKQEGDKKKKSGEAERAQEEKEEAKEVETLQLQSEGSGGDKEIVINIGVKKVSCSEGLLRKEPKSVLYQKAVKAEEGGEVSCFMDEAAWSIIFKWLIS